MKFSLLVLFFTLTTQVFAREIPECSQGLEVVPCELKKSDATIKAFDMILANKEGYKLVSEAGDFGMIFDQMRQQSLFHVILQSFKYENMHLTAEYSYEFGLNDCRGIDTCYPGYVWNVNETIEGDGYTASSVFKNDLKKPEAKK